MARKPTRKQRSTKKQPAAIYDDAPDDDAGDIPSLWLQDPDRIPADDKSRIQRRMRARRELERRHDDRHLRTLIEDVWLAGGCLD